MTEWEERLRPVSIEQRRLIREAVGDADDGPIIYAIQHMWGEMKRMEDGIIVYWTWKEREKHYMRMYKGFGVEESVVVWLLENEIPFVIAEVSEKGGVATVMQTTPDKLRKSIRDRFEGYGWQYFLPEARWTKLSRTGEYRQDFIEVE